VTGHFIQDVKLKSPLLKVIKVEGHHTAENITQVIYTYLIYLFNSY